VQGVSLIRHAGLIFRPADCSFCDSGHLRP